MAVDHGGSHRASTWPQAPAGEGATPGPGTLGRASLALAGPGHRALMAAEPDPPRSGPGANPWPDKPAGRVWSWQDQVPLVLERVANNNSSARPVVFTLLVALGVVGGLALLGWLGIVMLDLKHLNTSGFTLP